MKAFVAGAVVATVASLLGAVSYAAETGNQSPILIGLIAGTTGAYGSTGVAVVNGAQVAVDKINASGGVLGRQLKLDAQTITENWSTGATIGLMPQVNALKAAGLKCVVVWLTPQDQAAFVQDLHSVGYEATVFGNDETNADDTFAKLAGDLADGVITAALTSVS